MTFYSEMAEVASELLAEVKQGVVQLVRTTPSTPNPSTPWIPAEPTTATYALDAAVTGVSQQFVDGTTILATDLEITASVKARNSSGAEVEITPNMETDALIIDGKAVTIIRDLSVPAAGTRVALRFIVRA